MKKKYIADNIIFFIDKIVDKRYRNKKEFLNNCAEYASSYVPQIAKQKFLKTCYPRFTFTKQEGLNSLNQADKVFSNKVCVQNPNEIADLNFLTEANTASRFAETSSLIQTVTLNSEQKKDVPNFDVTIEVNGVHIISGLHIQWYMNSVFKSFLGEICYSENGNTYNNFTDEFSLKDVQLERASFLKLKEKTLHEYIIKINSDANLDIFYKNLLVQEELLKFIAANPEIKLKPSFYYGINVPERIHNKSFSFVDKIMGIVGNNNLKDPVVFKKLVKESIKAYYKENSEDFANIEKLRLVWLGSGFEKLTDNIFE